MIIRIKNKDTLIIDDFILKCSIGKNGWSSKKFEGDGKTPKGLFKLEKLYFRKDRVGVPRCNIKKKIIKKYMAWCDNPKHKKYNQEIHNYNKRTRENLFRKDHKYDYIITLNHNHKKIPYKGSAVFLHLTDNYKTTAGCIALKKKDFEIMLNLINQKTKIKIG